MRWELTTSFVDSFVRGARFGAWVTGATLALTLAGVAAVVVVSPVSIGATASPPAVTETRDMRVDRALIAAVEAKWGVTGEFAFALSREEAPAPISEADLVDLTPTPEPSPEPTPEPTQPPEAVAPAQTRPPPAPPAPAAPPLVVEGNALLEVLATAFPDPEFAYRVVMCESSGNARANTGNGYYGMWQFDLATWQSVGGAGLPSDASVAEQVSRARALYEVRGWQPWHCARVVS